MFHEYAVYQWMKARQEKVERHTRNAWMHQQVPKSKSETRNKGLTASPVEACCSCACS
ncbi:hypothetical protein [Fictibacillus sp. NRS-1165]|uniref:hypothetical protein n=1 Tax=Fictibacillus sp. NRS-1165 TaxID=3144463 RepID=UPI003D1CA91F